MILQDKVGLVTGGTTGIGRATAIALGAAGAKVVFSGRRDAEGEKTAKLIRETGAECLYVHSDVSKEEDIKALVQKTVAAFMPFPLLLAFCWQDLSKLFSKAIS
ncbi:MAG: SDR family NAD(P)-dependent oxidoreductase [Nostoc sp.]|uniref:SDR family NAD(P)-dependent oxidoreductase n=1 Tax=Nostoc sp. TaxID=1180 RepID=UPI002FFD36FB